MQTIYASCISICLATCILEVFANSQFGFVYMHACNVGWWLVTHEGKEGWAPSSYLEPVDCNGRMEEDGCEAGKK